MYTYLMVFQRASFSFNNCVSRYYFLPFSRYTNRYRYNSCAHLGPLSVLNVAMSNVYKRPEKNLKSITFSRWKYFIFWNFNAKSVKFSYIIRNAGSKYVKSCRRLLILFYFSNSSSTKEYHLRTAIKFKNGLLNDVIFN